MDLREIGWKGVDWVYVDQHRDQWCVAGSCEHGNEAPASKKGGELLD
jgi:hypothetical protein